MSAALPRTRSSKPSPRRQSTSPAAERDHPQHAEQPPVARQRQRIADQPGDGRVREAAGHEELGVGTVLDLRRAPAEGHERGPPRRRRPRRGRRRRTAAPPAAPCAASQTSTTSAMGSGVGLTQTARPSRAAELAQRPRQTSTSAPTASRATITSICPHAAPAKRMNGLKSRKSHARRQVVGPGPGLPQRRGHEVREPDGGRDHRQLERQVVEVEVRDEPVRRAVEQPRHQRPGRRVADGGQLAEARRGGRRRRGRAGSRGRDRYATR